MRKEGSAHRTSLASAAHSTSKRRERSISSTCLPAFNSCFHITEACRKPPVASRWGRSSSLTTLKNEKVSMILVGIVSPRCTSNSLTRSFHSLYLIHQPTSTMLLVFLHSIYETADLYSIIKATEMLEAAYSRGAAAPAEYAGTSDHALFGFLTVSSHYFTSSYSSLL